MKINKDGTPRKKKDSVCVAISITELENIKKILPDGATVQVGRKWYEALQTLGLVNSPTKGATLVRFADGEEMSTEETQDQVQFNEVDLEDYS